MLTIFVDPELGNFNIHGKDYSAITYSLEAYLAYGKISRPIFVTYTQGEAFLGGIFNNCDKYIINDSHRFSQSTIDFLVDEYNKNTDAYKERDHYDKVCLLETLLNTYNYVSVNVTSDGIIKNREVKSSLKRNYNV